MNIPFLGFNLIDLWNADLPVGRQVTRIFMIKYDLGDDPHDQRYRRSITDDKALDSQLRNFGYDLKRRFFRSDRSVSEF